MLYDSDQLPKPVKCYIRQTDYEIIGQCKIGTKIYPNITDLIKEHPDTNVYGILEIQVECLRVIIQQTSTPVNEENKLPDKIQEL